MTEHCDHVRGALCNCLRCPATYAQAPERRGGCEGCKADPLNRYRITLRSVEVDDG